MFRLFRGELKKIFSKPAIFIMTGLLILVLALAPQFFTPTAKKDVSSTNIVGETVYDRFVYFRESLLTQQSPSKYVYQDLEKSKTYLELFINSENTDFVKNLNDKLEEIQNLRITDFTQALVVEDVAQCKTVLEEMIKQIDNLKSMFTEYISYDVPLILLTNTTSTDFNFYTKSYRDLLENNLTPENVDNYVALDDLIKTNNYYDKIKNTISNISNTTYDVKVLNNLLTNYYTPTVTKLNNIYNQAYIFATNPSNMSSVSDTNIAYIDNLILDYLAHAQNATNIIHYGLLQNLSKDIKDSTISKYVGKYFENFNSYQVKENYNKYLYLFKNEKSDADYANVFAFNQASNKQANGYDYTYFTLEILSFLIIAFSVILAAGMIASEQSNGTLKLLAIRPYKRDKIMAAKIFATMFFATVFVVVSLIVTTITGLIVYKMNSLPILAIFNASHVFVVSAPVMLLIYVICLMLKIWVFVMLAFAISTLFKTNVGATIVSVMIYFVTMIVSFVAVGANWLKYILFANLDLFKYFGGSFSVQYTASQPLTNLFISPVFTDTNVIYTSVVIATMLIIFHLITYLTFKHRDIQ